jgi:hypothetical protein
LVAAQYAGGDQVLEAGHHGPTGYTNRSGKRTVGRYPGPCLQDAPVDGIQQRGG